MTVYSRQLVRQHVPIGVTLAVAVPADETWIIKQIIVQSQGDGCYFEIGSWNGISWASFFLTQGLPSGHNDGQNDMFVVCEYPDLIYVDGDIAESDVIVSGYKLPHP